MSADAVGPRPPASRPNPARIGLRAIAIIEALKAALALVLGGGLLAFVHRDVEASAEHLIYHLHLNPASRYPRLLLRVARGMTPASLRLLALAALVYAVLRSVEAVGLWRARRWAEWLGASTGLVYVPFEIVAIARAPGFESIGALAINLAIVIFLGVQLWIGSKSIGRRIDS